LMMSLWDALRMNMMISYQELVRTFPNIIFGFPCPHAEAVIYYVFVILYPQMRSNYLASSSQRYFSNDALVRYTESI
ncbi:hypothetical protein, partial [Citrobacter freundii complex sp. 2024EL-00748]|uniref:hypothetical protein n=1 Tax=Citrobacter freundii complex sp. 2024EL-00748 TaxID=3382813 RepID=UPI003BC9CB0F